MVVGDAVFENVCDTVIFPSELTFQFLVFPFNLIVPDEANGVLVDVGSTVIVAVYAFSASKVPLATGSHVVVVTFTPDVDVVADVTFSPVAGASSERVIELIVAPLTHPASRKTASMTVIIFQIFILNHPDTDKYCINNRQSDKGSSCCRTLSHILT